MVKTTDKDGNPIDFETFASRPMMRFSKVSLYDLGLYTGQFTGSRTWGLTNS